MKTRNTLMVVILMIFVLSACAKIRVESVPSGADVKINGHYFGKTPTRAINIKSTYPIEVSKEGYKTYVSTIGYNDLSPYIATLEEKEKEKSGLISVTITSEDGKIVTRKEHVYAETDTIERSPNVKSVRKVTDLSEFAWLDSFQISPDGGNIIFAQYEEETAEGKTSGYSNLWSIPTNGGPVRRITRGSTSTAPHRFRRMANPFISRPIG